MLPWTSVLDDEVEGLGVPGLHHGVDFGEGDAGPPLVLAALTLLLGGAPGGPVALGRLRRCPLPGAVRSGPSPRRARPGPPPGRCCPCRRAWRGRGHTLRPPPEDRRPSGFPVWDEQGGDGAPGSCRSGPRRRPPLADLDGLAFSSEISATTLRLSSRSGTPSPRERGYGNGGPRRPPHSSIRRSFSASWRFTRSWSARGAVDLVDGHDEGHVGGLRVVYGPRWSGA